MSETHPLIGKFVFWIRPLGRKLRVKVLEYDGQDFLVETHFGDRKWTQYGLLVVEA